MKTKMMGRQFFLMLVIVAGMLAAGTKASAQDTEFETRAVPAVAFWQVEMDFGRCGPAFGFGPSLEANVKPWFAIYGFAFHSGVDGYSAGQGITANLSAFTAGAGIKGRFFHRGRVALYGFAEGAGEHSQIRASYPNGLGGTAWYTSSDTEPVFTVGPEIEVGVVHGVALVGRLDKSFGNGLAATNAYGLSPIFGVRFDVKKFAPVAEKVGTGFRKAFRVKEPLPTI